MEGFSALILIIAVVFLYRHASGKAHYNRWLMFLLVLLSPVPGLITLAIGWHKNPRRMAGDSWKTVI